MFRAFFHAGRMLRIRRKIENQGALPGSHSAPMAWSTLLMACGGVFCLAGLVLPPARGLLLGGAPLLLVGGALAVLEALLDMR